jgi:hypothetical protein
MAVDVVAELLDLYRKHPTDAIELDGTLLLSQFGVASVDELMAIPGYPEGFGLVSSCAAIVSSLAHKYPDFDEQIRESIRLLRRLMDDAEPAKKVDTIQALVESRLRPFWSPPEQQAYDKKKRILEWRDFFVSYTNRDAPATNLEFRQLIKSCLGVAPKGSQNDSNYLARVITRHLRRYQGLAGFFDEDDLKVGETIKDEVNEYCTRAFALVQLLEPLTFEKQPPVNWCFYEYDRFSKNPDVVALMGDRNRHFFILTDAHLSQLQPASAVPLFDDWYVRISSLKKAHVSLSGERNTTLRAKVKAIATEILALRAEMLDAWLKQ